MLRDFRNFILRGNVLDLAVGVVVGATFSGLVNSFVANLIMSPLAAIFGKANYDSLTAGPFKYGAFLTSLVQFLIILTAVYFFVVRPMSGMMKRLGLVKEQPQVRECPACLQSIPAEASKCMYCTIDVEPVQSIA